VNPSMRILRRSFIGLAAAALSLGPAGASVLQYHGSGDRSGNLVVPALTFDKAKGVHIDPAFQAQVSGHVYAQPLYWQPPGTAAGMLLVASEDNAVTALDAATGKAIWHTTLAPPVPRSALSCGNIDPLGITGTPTIDAASQAIFLDAATMGAGGVTHLVYGLSLKDGSVLPGWPIDVAQALKAEGKTFNAHDQNERGALIILGKTVYVPFGGHFGDCGDYHGWVVGISLDAPHTVSSWETRARGGGTWAPGGISSDGTSLFVATGNTFAASTWMDGDAVLRLSPDLKAPTAAKDSFAPSNWLDLDRRDLDLGGANVMPLDVPAAGQTRPLALALGKDGKAYVLDRTNLGGVGATAGATVSTGAIRTGPAAFPASDGVFVAFQGAGAHCPSASQGNGLTMLKISGASPPQLNTAWCAALKGAGSPIVTTTDGHSNPIVWVVGAEGDNRLHGFRGDTGEVVFNGGGAADAMTGLRHFQTLIATDDHIYVAADGKVYAFAF
jgi:outer membrane protein assembly factor BamB